MASEVAGHFNGAPILRASGPSIEEVETNDLGFHAIAGDARVQLLTKPWPADNLPSSGCSLLAIASSKGLLAAAGPEGIIICSTDSLRDAFSAPTPTRSATKSYKAQLEIPIAQSISHVVFTADEASLVVVTQDDCGIIAFSTAAILQNQTAPAFNLPMPNIRFRHVLANPVLAAYFAVVTVSGELMIVDMANKQFIQGRNGPMLLNNCSCVAWSKMGKQLVAGRMDCTMVQMTPEGEVKAEIPSPPGLESGRHVSAIAWLENNDFLVCYSTADANTDFGVPAESYYFINRENRTSNFSFRSAPEAVFPATADRLPPKQFISRIMGYKPHLDDCLIVMSTSTCDVGLYTRSSKPLSNEHPNTAAITNQFTATIMLEDSRRAQLPRQDLARETTPIGVALDLSTKDSVDSPVPSEDILDSGVPLPGLVVLDSEGVLSYWYIVYTDAVKEKQVYGGLAVAKSQQSQGAAMTPAKPTQAAFTQPAMSNATASPPVQSPAFGKPSLPAFGQPAFGVTPAKPAAPAFGSPTPLSGPSFGTPSTPGSAFGKPSQLGAAGSGFGKPSTGGGFSGFASKGASGFSAFASTTTPFAQAAGAGQSTTSPFASAAGSSQGGFSGSGFGTGSVLQEKPSAFGTSTTPSAPLTGGFGKPSFGTGSPLKQISSSEANAPAGTNAPSQSSGFGSLASGLGKPANPFGPQPTKHTPALITGFNMPNSPAGTSSPMNMSPRKAITMSPPLSAASKEASPFAEVSMTEQDTDAPDPMGVEDVSKTAQNVAETEPSQAPVGTTSRVIAEAAPFSPDPTATNKEKPVQPKSMFVAGLEAALPVASASPTKQAAAVPDPLLSPQDTASKGKTDGLNGEGAAPLPPLSSDGESDADLADSHEFSAGEHFDGFSDVASASSDEEDEEQGFQEDDDSEDEQQDQGTFGSPAGGRTLAQTAGLPAASHPAVHGLISAAGAASFQSPSPQRRLTSISSKASQKSAVRDHYARNAQINAAGDTEDGQLVLEPAPEPVDAALEPEQDDEHEFLRQKLEAPIEPSPTLEALMTYQNYGGRIHKLAVQRKIELLYRDATAMIDTVGVNARTMASYLLYQNTTQSRETQEWLADLRSENSTALLDEDLILPDVKKLQAGIGMLSEQLGSGEKGQLANVLQQIHGLLGKDLVRLRGQCIALRQTLDAHTDLGAVTSSPLSAEQSTIQLDLRKASMELNTKIAELERELTNLRAKLADSAGLAKFKPSVNAVASTIAVMEAMVREKTDAIDELQVQMRELGINAVEPSIIGSAPLNGSSKGVGELSLYQRSDSSGLHMSKIGYGGSAAGILASLSEEEVQRLKSASGARRKALKALRQALEERDADVRVMS